jgi:hypothetical protein
MYVLRWPHETIETRTAFVEAESQMEAYEAWVNDQQVDESVLRPMEASDILDEIEEITDHDKLCCCPQCMNGAA